MTDAALPDLLGLPHVPVVVYQRPPLALALCQVRFPTLLEVANPQVVAPIHQALRARYPLLKQATSVQVQIVAGQASPVSAPPASPQWQFSDAGDEWQVVLSSDSVAIETRAYDRFTDFLDRLREVVDAVATHLQPSFLTRIGLRYINEIREPGMPWSAAIRPELLGAVGTLGVSERASTESFSHLTVRDDEGRGINFNHGLFPGGHLVNPRSADAPKMGPFYLLDFDASRELSPNQTYSMEPDAICNEVEALNRLIYDLFRWSISDAYVNSLGVRK